MLVLDMLLVRKSVVSNLRGAEITGFPHAWAVSRAPKGLLPSPPPGRVFRTRLPGFPQAAPPSRNGRPTARQQTHPRIGRHTAKCKGSIRRYCRDWGGVVRYVVLVQHPNWLSSTFGLIVNRFCHGYEMRWSPRPAKRDTRKRRYLKAVPASRSKKTGTKLGAGI